MLVETFNRMVENIADNYDRRAAGPSVRDRLWSKVKDIPDAAVPWITAHIEERESYPRNLGLEIKRAWAAWREQHPQKCARPGEGELHCPECCDGLLLMVRQEQRGGAAAWHTGADGVERPMLVRMAFGCARCNRASASARRFSTVERLEAQGWVRDCGMPGYSPADVASVEGKELVRRTLRGVA